MVNYHYTLGGMFFSLAPERGANTFTSRDSLHVLDTHLRTRAFLAWVGIPGSTDDSGGLRRSFSRRLTVFQPPKVTMSKGLWDFGASVSMRVIARYTTRGLQQLF